eukprot:TRINITY_DN2476_c1_g1_i3.p1 TRINITY_DN2476_c1_g1~~TRINITY_DN2476_c1_g1_i3.p1  ORF type:complete len:735 (-),score=168.82 TRINITY_DN2476_c1_g1_i3:380-2584(-)
MQPFSQHSISLEEQPFRGPPGQFLVPQSALALQWQSVGPVMNQDQPNVGSQLTCSWQELQQYENSAQNMQGYSQGWEQWPAQVAEGTWQLDGLAQTASLQNQVPPTASSGGLASDVAFSTDRHVENSEPILPSSPTMREENLQRQLDRLLEKPEEPGDKSDDEEPDDQDMEPDLLLSEALQQDISNAVASFLAGSGSNEDESEQENETDASDDDVAQREEECPLDSSIAPRSDSPQQSIVDPQHHQHETQEEKPSWREHLHQNQQLQAQQKQLDELLQAQLKQDTQQQQTPKPLLHQEQLQLPATPTLSGAFGSTSPPTSFEFASPTPFEDSDATRSGNEGWQNSPMMLQQWQVFDSGTSQLEQLLWQQQKLQQLHQMQIQQALPQLQPLKEFQQVAIQQDELARLLRLQQQQLLTDSWQEQVVPQMTHSRVMEPPPGTFDTVDRQDKSQIAILAEKEWSGDLPTSTDKAEAESSKLTLAELVPSRTSQPIEEVHPCMRRGQRLARWLKHKQLPQGITHEHIMILDKQVQHAVKALFSADKLPTVDAVQRMLRSAGVPAQILPAVLNVCVIYSNTFCLWVPPEGEISIVLLEEPLPPLEPEMVDAFDKHVAKLLTERLSAKKSRMKVELQSSIPPPAEGRTSNKSTGLSFNVKEVLPIGTGKISLADVESASLELAVELRRQGVTTLMMKNLPQNASQAEVVEELHKTGFEGCYDFFLPPSRLPEQGRPGICIP